MKKIYKKLSFLNFFGFIFLCFLVIDFAQNLNAHSLILWDWPALDTYSFLGRLQDETFLINDYYTNTSENFTPRTIYSYFIHLASELFNIHFVEVYKIIRIIIAPLFHTGIFLFLILLGKRLFTETRTVTILLGSTGIMVLYILLAQPITIAWWDFTAYGTHQSIVSLVIIMFCLSIIILRTIHYFLVYFLILLAGLLHPVLTVLSLPIFIFIDLCFNNKSHILPKSVSILRHPAVIISLIILTTVVVVFSDFINRDSNTIIYALQHSSHYLPSFWEPSNWLLQLVVFNILLIGTSITLRKMGNFLHGSLLIFFTIYNAVILCLQYFGVEILHSHTLILLGPSRGFVFLGLQYLITLFIISLLLVQAKTITKHSVWLALYFLGFLGLYYFSNQQTIALLLGVGYIVSMNLFMRYQKKISKRIKRIVKTLYTNARITWCVCFLIIFSIGSTGYYHFTRLQSPMQNLQILPAHEQTLITTIQETTSQDAIFIVPHSPLTTKIPLLAKRGLVIGNGFPFSSADWSEYDKRYNAIYGDVRLIKEYGGWIGAQYDTYYHNHTQASIEQLAKKYNASYMIFETPQIHHTYNFPILYADAVYTVYKIQSY